MMLEWCDDDAARVLLDISAERDRQERLKADGRFQYTCADLEMDNGARLAVLVEEVGEVGRELQPGGTIEKLREELIQVATVAAAWVEAIDRGASK